MLHCVVLFREDKSLIVIKYNYYLQTFSVKFHLRPDELK